VVGVQALEGMAGERLTLERDERGGPCQRRAVAGPGDGELPLPSGVGQLEDRTWRRVLRDQVRVIEDDPRTPRDTYPSSHGTLEFIGDGLGRGRLIGFQQAFLAQDLHD